MFEVFKESMNTRIKAVGILGMIFIGFSCVFYQLAITNSSELIPIYQEIMTIK
jgi:hypothetical protein